MWPNITSYPPESAEVVQELEFFAKVDRVLRTPIIWSSIDEENKCHTMHLARMRAEDGTSTTDISVRFAARYNAAARRLLTDHNLPLAPGLSILLQARHW